MSDNDEYTLIKSLVDCATSGLAMPDGWRLSYRSLQGQGQYDLTFDRPFQEDGFTGPTGVNVVYERQSLDDPAAYFIKSYGVSYG